MLSWKRNECERIPNTLRFDIADFELVFSALVSLFCLHAKTALRYISSCLLHRYSRDLIELIDTILKLSSLGQRFYKLGIAIFCYFFNIWSQTDSKKSFTNLLIWFLFVLMWKKCTISLRSSLKRWMMIMDHSKLGQSVSNNAIGKMHEFSISCIKKLHCSHFFWVNDQKKRPSRLNHP